MNILFVDFLALQFYQSKLASTFDAVISIILFLDNQFSSILNSLEKCSLNMLPDICISDLHNSLILYPYLYRYFHLLLKFCLFYLFIQTDCQPADFLFFLMRTPDIARLLKLSASMFTVKLLDSSVNVINHFPKFFVCHTDTQFLRF